MIKVRKVAAKIYGRLTGFDYRIRESYWQHLGAIASGRKERTGGDLSNRRDIPGSQDQHGLI